MTRFSLGRVVATPGVRAALERAGQTPGVFLGRHVHGDWGDLDASDKTANEQALVHGARILSKYHTSDGTAIYIITEATDDEGIRASTCLLLPDEY